MIPASGPVEPIDPGPPAGQGAGRGGGGRLVATARRTARLLPPILGLLLLVAAVYAIRREFRHLSLGQIRDTLLAMPTGALVAAGGCTLLSYFVLCFYDRLAVLHVGRRLSFGRTAFAAFCAYVLSHNLGFAAISGTAVRFRLYGSWGLKPLEITRIVAFCSVTYILGACALAGGVLLLEPQALQPLHAHLPAALLSGCGVAAWAVVAGYVLLSARLDEIGVGRWRVPLPGVRMAIGQVCVAALDVAATAAIAFVLLPRGAGLSYPGFLAIYIACYSAGLLASVPGGLGVFDGAMVLGLSPFLSAAEAVSVILVFRLFYYIVPLFLAGLLFAGHELFLRGDSLLAARSGAERVAPPRPSLAIRESEADFSVTVAAGAVILCGAMLLASGLFRPAPDDLAAIIPPLATGGVGFAGLFGPEAGSFARMVAAIGDDVLCLLGALLIGLAIGLSQRVTLAWGATLVALSVAAALSALRGLPLAVPALLILAALVVAPFRSSYYRHARLLSEPLSVATVTPLLLLLASVLGLARLDPGGTAAGGWLQSALGDPFASRRHLSVGLCVLVGLLALARLLRPGHVAALPFAGEARERYGQFAAAPGAARGRPRRADGLIAGELNRALLAFRREPGVLIGLGDPVGAATDRVSAIWRLRDLALEEKRDPVFWRVGRELLPVYADLGLVSWPIDEPGTMFLCCAAEQGEALIASFRRPAAV